MTTHMRILQQTLVVLILAVLLCTAGCISSSEVVKTEPVEIPTDMHTAMHELAADLSALEKYVLEDLNELAGDMTTVSTTDDIKQQLSRYYAEHPGLNSIIFYDALHEGYISVPVITEGNLSSYSLNLTEQDFADAGGLVVRNNVFLPTTGYVNLYYQAVYTTDGTYHGYIIFVTDVYSLLYLHPSIIGDARTYNKYVCFITDEENQIIYSSLGEAIGETMTSQGFYNGAVYVPPAASEEGACKYTSRGLYLYDRENQTEKVTAWYRIHSTHGRDYLLYLTGEVDPQELRTEGIVEPEILQTLNDTRGAFVYGTRNGKEELASRISSGYYECPMYLFDMNGTVIASDNPWTIGLNYLSTRDAYGYSYIEAAIDMAGQGSGYVYYMLPVEPTMQPQAAILRMAFVMSLDDSCFIYSPFTAAEDAVLVDYSLRKDTTVLSHALIREISASGLDTVVDKLNVNRYEAMDMFAPNLTATFTDVAILDVNGSVSASVKHPYLVGQSGTAKVDVFGGSATRLGIILAKTGGGYMTVMKQSDDDSAYADYRLTMIEPIDETYYCYTSTYVGTFENLLTPVMDMAVPTE